MQITFQIAILTYVLSRAADTTSGWDYDKIASLHSRKKIVRQIQKIVN